MDDVAIEPERERESLTVVSISGKHLLVDNVHYDPVILKSMRQGSYESGERAVISRLLKPGDRVIEIGTAVGLVAMLCADIVGSENVLCFEANPSLVADAERNFRENSCGSRIRNEVLQSFAKWSGPGSKSTFYVHKQFWASSLVDKPGTIDQVEVGNSCFEHEINQFDANTIVCDIEGGEIELLETSTLTGIKKIVLEIHYWAGRSKINGIIRKLIMDGFSIDFDLSGRSIVVLHQGLLPDYP